MEGEERAVIATFRSLELCRKLNGHVPAFGVIVEPASQTREHSVAVGLFELLTQSMKQVALDVNCSGGVW